MLGTYEFAESGLTFQFPNDWVVFKYDEHRFYRYVSGEGLKGVDFIGIRQDRLFLMEVKNYGDRVDLDTYDPMENLLNTAKEQAERYRRKLEDSLRLLEIIRLYYQRRWWYRRVYLPFLRKPEIKSELGFWTKATELKDRPEQITFILWLELPRSYNPQRAVGIREYFKKELEEGLSSNVQLEISYSEDAYGGISVM